MKEKMHPRMTRVILGLLDVSCLEGMMTLDLLLFRSRRCFWLQIKEVVDL